LKGLDDALEIRRRMLMAFEIAERTQDPDEGRAAMTFVVVGGGPTGVEMAGAISEIARYTLVRDFRHIDSSQARVILVDAAPRVLRDLCRNFPRARANNCSASGWKCGSI
jgi:NADH dehydrogenase